MLSIARRSTVARSLLSASKGSIYACQLSSSIHLDNEPIDEHLRHNVKLLGQILGGRVLKENKAVFDAVEQLRELGRKVRIMISLVSFSS